VATAAVTTPPGTHTITFVVGPGTVQYNAVWTRAEPQPLVSPSASGIYTDPTAASLIVVPDASGQGGCKIVVDGALVAEDHQTSGKAAACVWTPS
jgi:hypothetical protein